MMKLLIFKLKLAGHLSFFLLKLTANLSNKVKPAILGLFCLFLVITIIEVSKITHQQKRIIKANPPTNRKLYQLKTITKVELNKQVVLWEKVLKLQPKSRNVLINLSQLYSSLGEDEKAKEYLSLAKQIDPNNELLK